MPKRKATYKYLLTLYSRIDEYLSGEDEDQEILPDIVVSFCTVIERILKIKLHQRNPVLAFDLSKLKEDGALATVVLEKEDHIETIRIREAIGRFKVIFKKTFSEDELQALLDIYELRNCFVHGHKGDNEVPLDPEDVIKKMGTLWEKISPLAVSLFGKNAVRQSSPKKKYTEEELEKVLIEEVKEKIKSRKQGFAWFEPAVTTVFDNAFVSPWDTQDVCPRCDSRSFSFEGNNEDSIYSRYRMIQNSYSPLGVSNYFSGLYKCNQCQLELTPKEYEIAKKLKQSAL